MSRRTTAVVVLALLAVTAGCTIDAEPRSPSSPSAATLTVTVSDVVDGDTLDIRYRNGSTDTVRLLGVDTPEVHVDNEPGEFEGVPSTRAGAACLREAGHAATDYVAGLVLGRRVRLTFDPEADRRGGYGRLLAYVAVNSTRLNYQLLARGHARVYDTAFTRSDQFYAAESTAQARQRGLWRCRRVATAASGRRVAGQ